jgi:transposase
MPIGRPIAASDAQIANVRKLRKGGMSLRNIATETNLGMQTVRTIIGKAAGSDRATMKRLERLDPERADLAAWKARKRTMDALPQKITETLEAGAALIKAAKGLGG